MYEGLRFQFSMTSVFFQGNETVIRRTQNVGDRLISSGHYATNAIKTQMNRLNDEWQNLTRLLDNRTNILTASLQFHQKADEVKSLFLKNLFLRNFHSSFKYLVQVPTWKHLCSLGDDLTTIESMEHLERLLQQHFHLSENISRIYAQVSRLIVEKYHSCVFKCRSVTMEKLLSILLLHHNR